MVMNLGIEFNCVSQDLLVFPCNNLMLIFSLGNGGVLVFNLNNSKCRRLAELLTKEDWL